MRNDGNLRRRIIVKNGKFDKTARFLPLNGKEIFAPVLNRAVFLSKFLFGAPFFTEIIKYDAFEEAVSPNDSTQLTERTLKWPILRT